MVRSGHTSARCSSFSASVWLTGFTYVNLNYDCPENTGLGFAKCGKVTGAVPSVARRRVFRSQRPLLFPTGCFRQGADVTFNYAEIETVNSSTRVRWSHLTVDNEGTVTTNEVGYDVLWGAKDCLLVEATPCLFTPSQSLTLCPPRPIGHDRLSFTSVVPVLHCSVCEGNVKAFSDGGSISVFKVDGLFYTQIWNIESSLRA